MKKLNFFVGKLQPVTQGHINCINEGDASCIVYRINSSNKTIERKKKGIKIGSKSWTDESVNKVIEYIDNPTSDLTEQEKELLKRPFTNELIDKELEIVKKANKNIINVVPVVNVYDALGKYNQFITEHSDEYEVGDWMCGDDRKDDYEKNVEGLGKYAELEVEFKSGKTLPNILIGKLKVNTGKGRTEGVSGTAVRKAILNKNKAAFEKIMPKGVGSMFDDFTKAFDEFKNQLQNIIKEHKMMTLKEYIIESLHIKDIDIKSPHNIFYDKDTIYNIIIAAYLSINRYKCWEEGPTFQKKIKYIVYDDILNILNETFNYDFDKKDIKVKTGYIWKIVKQYLIPIQNMCNYHNAIVKINDERITINYKDIDEKYNNILKNIK